MRQLGLLLATLLVSVLTGCQSPLVSTFSSAFPRLFSWAEKDPKLDPAFQYIRVDYNNRAAYLALGSVGRLRGFDGVEHYYSGSREVLSLYRGRVVGLSGSTVDYSVASASPSVPEFAVGGSTWDRVRDVQPGGLIGVRERMSSRRVSPPPSIELRAARAESLDWYEEVSEPLQPLPGLHVLPPARFAFDAKSGRVVYGEECLTVELCLRWQRWPVR
jgi:hypothetical protein